MKWKKLLFSTVFLGVSLAGCGGDDEFKSPFDSRFEVSYEVAQAKVNEWKAAVDESITYIAHYTITNKDSDRQYHYKADYTGHPGEEFTYVEGSLDETYSSISDTNENFRSSISMGYGFTYIEKKEDDSGFNYDYHYYIYNNQMSFYVYGSRGGYVGYSAMTINEKGLITFLEWYEAEDDLSFIQTQRATYETLQ